MTLPAAYKETGPWSAAAPADAAPRGPWWGIFKDPALDALEAEADKANPTLLAALAAYDQARAAAAAAQSALVPTLFGVDSETYNQQSAERPLRSLNQPNDYANNFIGASVGYEFDFWGRVRNLVAAGRAQAQAGAADLATARLSLEAELASTYLSLRGLDAQGALLQRTVEAYDRALALTRARHLGGASSGLDEERARAQLANAKAQLEDVKAARALLEHVLAALVGTPASLFSLPPGPGPVLVPDAPSGLASDLLQRRPDVAAAERRAFAANRLIGVAKAAYFPQVTLNAQFGFQNTGGNTLLTAPDTAWTLGPQLAGTLLDGGLLKAGVASARARFQGASADYRKTVLTAFQEVEDALALANRYSEEAQATEAAVNAADATTRLSLIRYREGATNYLDVVTAQTAQLQNQEIALNLETRRQLASVALIKAIGGGWTRDALPSLRKAAAVEQKPRTP